MDTRLRLLRRILSPGNLSFISYSIISPLGRLAMSPLSSLRCPNTKHFYESASYISANRRFTDAFLKNYQGDVTWMNNYHLMLLPNLLRSSPKLPRTAPIGFSMHVAFPSSEIFRCLFVRQDLLLGLLGADLVGFQTANYARPRGVQRPSGGGRGRCPRWVGRAGEVC